MQNIKRLFKTYKAFVVFSAMLLPMQGVWATTHIVQFGGSFGFSYSPAAFAGQVGDTVTWQGDFSMHPLSSTTVPATATTWHNGSGSSFSYVIKIAGVYHYQCDLHASNGMIGAFSATENPLNILMRQAFEQTKDLTLSATNVSGDVIVNFSTIQSQPLVLKLFDLSGHEIATVLNKVVQAGKYSIKLGSLMHASGFYFVKLSTNRTQRIVPIFKAN